MSASPNIILIALLHLSLCLCSSDKDSTTAPTKASTGSATASSYDNAIMALINAHRQSLGLSLLQPESFLQELAAGHSQNMADKLIPLGHQDFDTRQDAVWRERHATSVGENVAYNQLSAEQVVKSWLESEGHRQNIEGNFNVTGLSAIQDKNGSWYYTQIFALIKN